MGVVQGKLSKSEQIRRLFDGGMKVADIANYMNVRYQFAYNVISYHVKTKGGSDSGSRTYVNGGLHTAM